MTKVLAKIGRQNHLNHLVAIMPLITIVYCIQCYVMHSLAPEIEIGNYAINLGILLSMFIGMMVYYDNSHNVLIYSDHLHVHFGLLGIDQKINYEDIKEIHAPEKECAFSNLIIETKDKRKHVFYFVDFPLHVKALIESQMDDDISQVDDFKDAA
jgi:hypothetical protein